MKNGTDFSLIFPARWYDYWSGRKWVCFMWWIFGTLHQANWYESVSENSFPTVPLRNQSNKCSFWYAKEIPRVNAPSSHTQRNITVHFSWYSNFPPFSISSAQVSVLATRRCVAWAILLTRTFITCHRYRYGAPTADFHQGETAAKDPDVAPNAKRKCEVVFLRFLVARVVYYPSLPTDSPRVLRLELELEFLIDILKNSIAARLLVGRKIESATLEMLEDHSTGRT